MKNLLLLATNQFILFYFGVSTNRLDQFFGIFLTPSLSLVDSFLHCRFISKVDILRTPSHPLVDPLGLLMPPKGKYKANISFIIIQQKVSSLQSQCTYTFKISEYPWIFKNEM